MSSSAGATKKKKAPRAPTSPSAASVSGATRGRESELHVTAIPDDASVVSSPRRGGNEGRPRFDSKASWADSTRFDMGRADSRASDVSARDLRLTSLSRSHASNRNRSDSRASRMSRASSRAGGGANNSGMRGRQSSFVSNFGVTKGGRKDSNALSTITENWNLADDQFGSPFADFDAQGAPRERSLCVCL